MFANDLLIQEMPKLNRFALRLTKNQSDASDLVQATFLRAIEKKSLFEEGTNLFSWTSKIMFNLFATAYKRKARFETQYDPDDFIALANVKATQEISVEYGQVQKAIKKLSVEHQQIIFLVCIKGISYENTATALNIPVGTVRSRLSRARESLQQQLQPIHGSVFKETSNSNTKNSKLRQMA